MLKNAAPQLNLRSDKMGHLVFMGELDSPMKTRRPVLLDGKFSSGAAFLSILKIADFT